MMFQSTQHYILSPELALAVNAAVTLEKPLLLKGEPGTIGKFFHLLFQRVIF